MNELRSLIIGMAALVGLSGPAQAGSLAEVRDGAALFHRDTITKVNKILLSIQDTFHRDVLIETVKELSPEDLKLLDGVTMQRKYGKIFGQMCERMAEEKGINGVYVLIIAHPRYKDVEVRAWPPEDPLLTDRICNQARRAFLNGQKHSGPDQGLFDLVYVFQNGFEDHLVSSVPWWILALIIGFLLLIWIAALAIRFRLHGSASADKPGGESAGHDKVIPGMLGGMFGSMAGHWIYDSSLHHEAEPTPPTAHGRVVTRGFPLPLGQPPLPKSEDGPDTGQTLPDAPEIQAGDTRPRDEAEARP